MLKYKNKQLLQTELRQNWYKRKTKRRHTSSWDKVRWNVYTMYSVHLFCTSVLLFFYLYNVHIKECTFVLFDKPILQLYKKKSLQSKNTRTNSFFRQNWDKIATNIYQIPSTAMFRFRVLLKKTPFCRVFVEFYRVSIV